MSKYLLSVYIPNYNHAQYLPECVNSVLNEAPEETEILIIDDASTDNSIELIKQLMKKDRRIQLIQNQKNQGANAALQLGLERISGKYSLALAADDRILPGFLQETTSLLTQYPQVALCCSDYAYFYPSNNNQIFVKKLLAVSEPFLIFDPAQTLKIFETTHFWIPGHTTVVQTDLARKYGGYQDRFKQSSDFYLFHKIALNHPIAYIPKEFSAMRILPNSFSSQCIANRKYRNKAARTLLDAILKDKDAKLFQDSTILAPILRRTLLQTLLFPKYWGFLWKVGLKKFKYIMRK